MESVFSDELLAACALAKEYQYDDDLPGGLANYHAGAEYGFTASEVGEARAMLKKLQNAHRGYLLDKYPCSVADEQADRFGRMFSEDKGYDLADKDVFIRATEFCYLKSQHRDLVEQYVCTRDVFVNEKKRIAHKIMRVFLDHYPEYAACCSEYALKKVGWIVSKDSEHAAFSEIAKACGWKYVRTISPPPKNDGK